MRRRDFILNSAAASGLISLGGITAAKSIISDTAKKITILHTNDVHSHIDPFPSNDPKYANKGGAARRMAMINTIRKENPNTLLLDAGDMFQGTPYFNFYGGELEFKIMSKLGYDAATIGNHDFDNGIDGLAAQMEHAQFEILTANYDLKNTIMDGFTKSYRVFVKDGIRIGVFGIGIKLSGLVNKNLYKETVYLDPIEVAQDCANNLRENEYCDLVICLSHLGYDYRNKEIPSDLMLAQKTSDIDLIIGGHTHTFLEKPSIIQNKKEKFVLVNQVGWGGIQLGRVDFYLDKNSKKSNSVFYNI